MGIWADLINRFTAKTTVFAVRDTTAAPAPDNAYVPLQVDGDGNLKTTAVGAATEATVAAIEANTDGLEASASATAASVANIDANTDGLEALAASILTALGAAGVLNQQATQAQVLAALGASGVVPLGGTLSIGTTATDLTTVTNGNATSVVSWEIQVPDKDAEEPVYVGQSGVTATGATRGREVLPGEAYRIPSKTLAGWFAIAELNPVSVRITGAGSP